MLLTIILCLHFPISKSCASLCNCIEYFRLQRIWCFLFCGRLLIQWKVNPSISFSNGSYNSALQPEFQLNASILWNVRFFNIKVTRWCSETPWLLRHGFQGSVGNTNSTEFKYKVGFMVNIFKVRNGRDSITPEI